MQFSTTNLVKRCTSIIGCILLLLMTATLGCGLVVRNEQSADVKRLAENWPPYQAPYATDPGTGERVPARTLANSGAPSAARQPTAALATKILVPVRRAEDWDLSETAVDSLGRIGAPAVPALINALEHHDPLLRVQAAKVLARIGPEAKQSVTALVRSLDDDNEIVRKAAARALGQIGPAAEDAVLPLLDIIEQSPPGTAAVPRESNVIPALATEPVKP